MMVEDGSIEVLKLLSSTSSKIVQGEVLQLQHKGEVDMLEETYLKIISAKTASLFSAATKVGSILASKESKIKEALEFYGKNLGLTFQIADDTLDYNSELKFFGKKIGNDFYEGKVTLPIILLYQKANNDEKVEFVRLCATYGALAFGFYNRFIHFDIHSKRNWGSIPRRYVPILRQFQLSPYIKG